MLSFASPPRSPRHRGRPRRLFALTLARGRRLRRRAAGRLMLFGGWTWVAAGSLIGFEMLDLIFGTLVLTPELLPLVLIGLACAWYFRDRLRRAWRRTRAWLRLNRLNRRMRRAGRPPDPFC